MNTYFLSLFSLEKLNKWTKKDRRDSPSRTAQKFTDSIRPRETWPCSETWEWKNLLEPAVSARDCNSAREVTFEFTLF